MLVTLKCARRWCLSVFLAWGLAHASDAGALPIERFDVPVEVECSDNAPCSGVVRSQSTLGRYTGISLSRRGEGEVAARVRGKENSILTFEASDTQSATMTLSWDADQHPELLSGAGLNCLDLTRGGAFAFILSTVSIDAECVSEESTPSSCPIFSVESRIYDAHDPTGQRFSGSVITRNLTSKTDIVIPFSNFVREGPRGKAEFSCVGAITMMFRFDGFEAVEMELGPVYTNGAEGLTPIPTATSLPTSTPTASPTVTATPVVTAIASGSVTPAVPGSASTPPPTVVGAGEQARDATAGVQPSAAAEPPSEEAAPVQPVVPRIPPEQDEEIVYGALVAGE